MDQLLTDKYGPKEISDVIGNKETINTLKILLKTESIPHLLFTGPPGTGKTTVAKIFSKKMDRKNVLELNASDERGIETVRTTIKNFSMRVTDGLKIIILDECDSMTSAAQQAMRRTMELCAKDCRFILICNNIQKITEPIQSRCAVFLFDRIQNDEMKKKLKEITENENLGFNSEALDTILFLANSDMRQAINIIQSTLYSVDVDENMILKVTGQPSPKLIEEIIVLLLKKEIENAIKAFDIVWSDGYDPQDLLVSFFRVAKNMDNFELLKCISQYQLRLSEGSATKLQFYALLYEITTIY